MLSRLKISALVVSLSFAMALALPVIDRPDATGTRADAPSMLEGAAAAPVHTAGELSEPAGGERIQSDAISHMLVNLVQVEANDQTGALVVQLSAVAVFAVIAVMLFYCMSRKQKMTAAGGLVSEAPERRRYGFLSRFLGKRTARSETITRRLSDSSSIATSLKAKNLSARTDIHHTARAEAPTAPPAEPNPLVDEPLTEASATTGIDNDSSPATPRDSMRPAEVEHNDVFPPPPSGMPATMSPATQRPPKQRLASINVSRLKNPSLIKKAGGSMEPQNPRRTVPTPGTSAIGE